MSSILRVIVAFSWPFGLYMLLAGSLSWTELLAALPVAIVVAAFSFVQRIRRSQPLNLPIPPSRVTFRVLLLLATDTFRVGVALARSIADPPSGTAHWKPFRPGGCVPREAGRRSLVTLAASLAPNGFVLDVKPSYLPNAQNALLLHTLLPTDPSRDEEWPV